MREGQMQVIVCRYKQAQLVQQVAGISSSLKLMEILQDEWYEIVWYDSREWERVERNEMSYNG